MRLFSSNSPSSSLPFFYKIQTSAPFALFFLAFASSLTSLVFTSFHTQTLLHCYLQILSNAASILCSLLILIHFAVEQTWQAKLQGTNAQHEHEVVPLVDY
jgi:hypothetical protein